jgi:hypothetical protein
LIKEIEMTNFRTAKYDSEGVGIDDPQTQFQSVRRTALYTKQQLIALAESNQLKPGVQYQTVDGIVCLALTSRYLQPLSGVWHIDGRRWSVGASLSEVDVAHTYLPPLAPNANVQVQHRWEFDPNTQTKRGRLVLAGQLGIVNDAVEWFNRNFNGTNDRGANVLSILQNLNDAALQHVQEPGSTATFGITINSFVGLSVNTDTSKLLRARGTTTKTGSNVTITNLTSSAGVATAVASAHGLTTGDNIGATGATQSEYNVDPVQVTVLDANTFTYPITGVPASPATGSPVFQKYNNLALRMFTVYINQSLGAV